MLRRRRSAPLLVFFFLVFLAVTGRLVAQNQQQFGKIIGQIRIARGDFPPHQIMVELRLHGGTLDSVYADSQGRFGFENLLANLYHVVINDEDYGPVDEQANVNPVASPYVMMQIFLQPRESTRKDDPAGKRLAGSNPYLIDLDDYNRRFPKKAVKEYEKGVEAEIKGKRDEAITHYEKALSYSPDFYPAHNNLGSAYLARQNFEAAQSHFEAALKTNQNDAQAYFNLANVLLLTQHYDAAHREVEEGLQRRPDSAFGHFLQGSLYSHTGRPELAEKSLQDALKLDPTMSQVYLQLVNLYLQQKRTVDAISELEGYLKAFPNTPFSPQARELLKRLQGEVTTVSQ